MEDDWTDFSKLASASASALRLSLRVKTLTTPSLAPDTMSLLGPTATLHTEMAGWTIV